MYYGCKHSGKPDWLSNRTTLTDMGELFEGVDTKAFFPQQVAGDARRVLRPDGRLAG